MFRAVAKWVSVLVVLGIGMALVQDTGSFAVAEPRAPEAVSGEHEGEDHSPDRLDPGNVPASLDMEAIEPPEPRDAVDTERVDEGTAEDIPLEDSIPSAPPDEEPSAPIEEGGVPPLDQLIPGLPTDEDRDAQDSEVDLSPFEELVPGISTDGISELLRDVGDRDGLHMIMEPIEIGEDGTISWGTPQRQVAPDLFLPELSGDGVFSPSEFGLPGLELPDASGDSESIPDNVVREIMMLMGEGEFEAIEELLDEMDAPPELMDFVEQMLVPGLHPELEAVPELEEIHVAAKEGDVPELRRLLEEDPDAIDAGLETGRAGPLHLAAGYGHEKAVAFLLEQGADIEALTEESHTPLHYAVYSGRSGVVELLLEAGAPRDVADSLERTALDWVRAERGLHHLLPLFPEYAVAAGEESDEADLPYLHQMARDGQLDQVQEWVQAEPDDIDRTDVHGRTPLHMAALMGRVEIAAYLIAAGADPNSIDEDWRTPLHEAVAGGHTEIVEALLAARTQPNARDSLGQSAMHLAAERGSVSLLRMLGSAAGAFEARDRNYVRPIHLAAKNGHMDAVEYLLGLGASVDVRDAHGRSPLYWAVLQGHEGIGRRLLDVEPVIEGDNNNTTPLHLAAAYNFTSIAELLLEHGADIEAANRGGHTPVDYALSLGRSGMAEFLEEHAGLGIPTVHRLIRDGDLQSVQRHLRRYPRDLEITDNRGRTPLHVAAEEGAADIAALLLELGADPDSTDENLARPLHKAAERNHVEVAAHLVHAEAQVNRRDGDGQSALHLAAAKGAVEAVEFLIGEGGVVDIRDVTLSRPLHLAALNGHVEVVERLLDAGAPVGVTNEAGRSPLHLAVLEGHERVVQRVLAHGVDLDGDNNGETPLHLAVSVGQESVIQMLLDHGADLQAPARSGETPWDYAVSGEKRSILELFANHDPDLQAEYETIAMLSGGAADPEEGGADDDQPADRFREAIAEANVDVLREVLADHPVFARWTNSSGMTALHYAVIFDLTDVVEMLLDEYEVDPNVANARGETPLHYAASLDREHIAAMLVERGANRHRSDDSGRYPRQMANSSETADLLGASSFPGLGRSQPVSRAFGAQPFPWLEDMIERESVPDVEFLLGRYMDQYVEGDENGDTPLHWAARDGQMWLVDLTIEAGISVNTRNHEGARPIHLAAANGHLDVVKRLVEEGSGVTTDRNWRTPLHMAAALGDPEMVAYLLDKGAPIDAMSRQRRTPLDYALELGRREAAELLIERGATANIYDVETAAD